MTENIETFPAVPGLMAVGTRVGVLNARTDVFLHADADRGELLQEAVRRGKAFLDAGAPVVFVAGVVAREEICVLVEEFDPQKLSVISVPGASLPARELQELGVARVSTGPFTQRSH